MLALSKTWLSLRRGFSASRDPWGSWLERILGIPEAWPGRGHALSSQLVPRKQELVPMEAGKGGVGSGYLFKQQYPRGWHCVWMSVCCALHGAGSGLLPCPEGTRAVAGSWAAQRSAAMRSQESMRGSPRQGLEWVGRGSRKVLRIWVSGRCGARGPWGPDLGGGI